MTVINKNFFIKISLLYQLMVYLISIAHRNISINELKFKKILKIVYRERTCPFKRGFV
jgi:hypothetical protein